MKRVAQSLFCAGVLGWAFLSGGCATGPHERTAGQVVDDTTILAKVKAALVNDPAIAGRSIKVDVYQGEVTLSGAVSSDTEKKKAEDIAVGVNGVRTVRDQLVVRTENEQAKRQ
jgi:hyperosmotically inducible protein